MLTLQPVVPPLSPPLEVLALAHLRNLSGCNPLVASTATIQDLVDLAGAIAQVPGPSWCNHLDLIDATLRQRTTPAGVGGNVGR